MKHRPADTKVNLCREIDQKISKQIASSNYKTVGQLEKKFE